MKRLALLLLLGTGLVPAAFAQETDHLQVGVYADYFGLKQTKTNFAGLGARVGIPAIRHVNFEGEINYDFDQVFNGRIHEHDHRRHLYPALRTPIVARFVWAEN